MSNDLPVSSMQVVWDNHACIPLRFDDREFLPQLGRYRAAGADVVSVNVGFDLTSVETNFRVLSHFRAWLQENDDSYSFASSVDAIMRAKTQGKLAVAFDLEGTQAIDGQISLISAYYDLGVRWMLIAYNRNNLAGGGCQDDDEGLTEFGGRVVDEMARVGMVVCCSHTGHRTARDVMDRSSLPVIFSHSNPSGVWQHPRNIPDELIKACARTGGVIGINGVGPFLGRNDPTVDRIVAHVDYTVQLVGPEHVGLGLDYCFDQKEVDAFLRDNPRVFPSSDGYAQGMRFAPPECLPEIAQRLERMGYARSAVDGIMGLNFLRVARQVWR